MGRFLGEKPVDHFDRAPDTKAAWLAALSSVKCLVEDRASDHKLQVRAVMTHLGNLASTAQEYAGAGVHLSFFGSVYFRLYLVHARVLSIMASAPSVPLAPVAAQNAYPVTMQDHQDCLAGLARELHATGKPVTPERKAALTAIVQRQQERAAAKAHHAVLSAHEGGLFRECGDLAGTGWADV